jgi:hypothetical protein
MAAPVAHTLRGRIMNENIAVVIALIIGIGVIIFTIQHAEAIDNIHIETVTVRDTVEVTEYRNHRWERVEYIIEEETTVYEVRE